MATKRKKNKHYSKTHTSKKAANSHMSKLKARGAKVVAIPKGKTTQLNYHF